MSCVTCDCECSWQDVILSQSLKNLGSANRSRRSRTDRCYNASNRHQRTPQANPSQCRRVIVEFISRTSSCKHSHNHKVYHGCRANCHQCANWYALLKMGGGLQITRYVRTRHDARKEHSQDRKERVAIPEIRFPVIFQVHCRPIQSARQRPSKQNSHHAHSNQHSQSFLQDELPRQTHAHSDQKHSD